ncbi:MAG: NAD-binding protein [Candidatus Obscuribacterales bacterium]|nr:NAD-binding protein [Candidatus Obscuribacterales bacterium]
MVEGAEEDFNQVLPLLAVMGKTVKHCGPVRAGQALKLRNQVLCAVNMIAVSEALTLSQALGVDPSLVVDVLKNGAGGSWALENLGQKS